ncbi:MAG: O-antigen ligase family protein [Thermoguttaceae bacterium]
MEALAIVAAVVVLIATAAIFVRGGLMAGCLVVMVAGTCFSVPFYKTEGSLPLTADRVLIALLVMQCLVWRRWGLAERKPWGKPEILLGVFLAMLTVSTFSHDWRALESQTPYQPVAWLVVFYFMPAAMYWVARQIRYSERTVLPLFGGLAVFGVYLAVTSLAEYCQAWWLVWPSYIATTAADKLTEFVGRARGPLLNPIANGILLAACFAAALMWWPWLRGRPVFVARQVGDRARNAWWGSLRSTQPTPAACGRKAWVDGDRPHPSPLPKGEGTVLSLRQLVLAAVAALFLAAFCCTLTRSVWMGGVLVLALCIGLALPWNWRLPLLGGGLAVAILLAATHWDELVMFKRDEALGADKTAESVELRPILARIAWNMFLDRPLFGCGYYQYQKEHLDYLSDRSTGLALERAREFIQHNVALSLLTETGLFGLSLFAAMLFLWARDAWRLWRDAALPLWARQAGLVLLATMGAYVINGMFHDVSVMAMANMTLFFLAGVVAGLRGRDADVGYASA